MAEKVLITPGTGETLYGSYTDKEKAKLQESRNASTKHVNKLADRYVQANFLTGWYHKWRLKRATNRLHAVNKQLLAIGGQNV